MTNKPELTDDRLDKIIEETSATIAERKAWSNTDGGSIEVNAALFLDVLRELQERRKPVITFYSEGIAAAANWVDQQRESYDNEHGRRDNDTGSFEFGNDAQRDYSDTLAEIAEGIRALHPSTSEQERRKADSTEFVSFDELNAAVAEVTGCNQHAWNANIYKGHQAVPFMNYNSLARIVDKYRAPQPAPVVPDEKPMPEASKMHAIDAVAAIAEVRGWNACRAAMLQAGNFRETTE